MKLYATTTSERASKGQGGNSLLINIQGEGGIELANIKVSSFYPYEYNIDVFPIIPMKANKLEIDIKGDGYKVTKTNTITKGKSQKGE